MTIPAPQTATATDSPDGSLSDDATAVQISESPSTGEVWYVEGFSIVGDGAGSDITGTNYQAATAIWTADITDANIGSGDPTSNSPARGGTVTDIGSLLGTDGEGAWVSIGDLMHPNEKAVLNIVSDSTSSSTTVTYRMIARQVA